MNALTLGRTNLIRARVRQAMDDAQAKRRPFSYLITRAELMARANFKIQLATHEAMFALRPFCTLDPQFREDPILP